MSILYTLERPSVLPDACALARALRVGYLPVPPVPTRLWHRDSEQLITSIQQPNQEKSAQLQVGPARTDRTNGLTAKATGMALALFMSVDASGVPPRGKPV